MSSSESVPSDGSRLAESGAQPKLIDTPALPDQTSSSVFDLVTAAGHDGPDQDCSARSTEVDAAEEEAATGMGWDSTAEQEWSEHSATAWALAHVIHRIRSTPLPPILSPEQRRHFQKVVQMAGALMEEWQRRERDQAQRLAIGRPLIDMLLGPPNTAEPLQPASPRAEAPIAQALSLPQQIAPEDSSGASDTDRAGQK